MKLDKDTTARINSWKQKGFSIVFTNGCFDILHRGHIDYLQEAASFGDRLIIGLNSDSSVRKLKGEKRPVQNEKDRLAILSALKFVDMVLIFEEETPLDLITAVRPDVLVKGGDYDIDTIVGAREVVQFGGRVQIIPLTEGKSTSEIIDKIQSVI